MIEYKAWYYRLSYFNLFSLTFWRLDSNYFVLKNCCSLKITKNGVSTVICSKLAFPMYFLPCDQQWLMHLYHGKNIVSISEQNLNLKLMRTCTLIPWPHTLFIQVLFVALVMITMVLDEIWIWGKSIWILKPAFLKEKINSFTTLIKLALK